MSADPPQPPAWREKAGGFVRSSSVKLKAAASRASEAVAGAAEGAGTAVKSTWTSTKEGWSAKVQPNLEAGYSTAARVAAETGSKLRKGFLDTRERVAGSQVGQRLSDPGQQNDLKAVFGVPLEVLVQRQNARPVPLLVIKCADYLASEEGAAATIPAGASPLDVAQLLMVYFKCLPDPLLTFELYDKIASIGNSDVPALKALVASLPPANHATLEVLAGLLLRVSEKSAVNKMDAHSLAVECAPLLLWPKGSPSSATGTPKHRPSSPTETPNGPGSESPMMQPSAPPVASGTEAADGLPPVPTPEDVAATLGPVGAEPASSLPASEELASGPAANGFSRSASAASDTPAEIPLETEPSREQKNIVEAVLACIEHHSVIFG
eukprot:jgi/Mesen1/1623/ME000135S00621